MHAIHPNALRQSLTSIPSVREPKEAYPTFFTYIAFKAIDMPSILQEIS